MTPPWTPGDRTDVDGPPPYGDSEFRQRLENDLRANIARRQARRDTRQQFHQRRQHGLNARHAQKLARKDTTMPMTAIEALDQVLRQFDERGLQAHLHLGWVPTSDLRRWREALSAARHPARQKADPIIDWTAIEAGYAETRRLLEAHFAQEQP